MKLDIQKFASGESQWFEDLPLQMKLTWESTAGDSSQNYSTVTVRIWGARDSSTTKGKSWHGYVNIGGNNHSFSEIYTGTSTTVGGAWVLMAYYTDTIYHDNDGSKTITISGGLGGPSGTSLSNKWCEGSISATLDTIPRGSTFDTLNWDKDTQRQMNSTLSIPTTQHVTGVYHKLEARFMNNGTETTICTRTGVSITSNTISFTFSSGELNTVYNLLPNDTSHYIRMYLYTYTDSGYTNQLGDVSIVWWTGVIPSSVIPSISIGTITEANTTMSSLNWGVFVQGKSQLGIPITATGINNSTITGTTTTVNGIDYSGTSITTNLINTTGSVSITSTTTDSRNRTNTATTTVSVVGYSNPQIVSPVATRCDSLGNDDDNGTYLKYSFSGTIDSVSNHNSHTFRIGYKEKGTSTFTYTNVDTTNYTTTKTDQVLNLNLDASKTYIIVFEAIDSFTTTAIERQIDTGFDLMNFNPSGIAMAIGKVSEATSNQELLEVALPTKFTEDITTIGDISVTGDLTLNGSSIFDLIYPVDSIYMSVNSTNPGILFGGTWVALEDRFLIGASATYTAGSTGGEETHTLTNNELPVITGRLPHVAYGENKISGVFSFVSDAPNHYEGQASSTKNTSAYELNIGGGQAHNNLPPYLAVYMWKRTA